MEWVVFALIAVIVVGFLFMRRSTLVGEPFAAEWIRKGAKVIDVRTESEYEQRHIPGAVNLPLDRLNDGILREVPGTEEVVLLHCAAGGRSAIGCRKLKKLGYKKAYNLGSIGRAERIVAAARTPAA